jgi:N,N'-diacetyllegionaminate synthase
LTSNADLTGSSRRCLIIAEVAQAHDGSLGMAHAFIDAAARAGADAIKFQTHIAAAESTPGEPWRVKFSYQDVTRYDYWKRMGFSEDQWHGLKKHADERGLKFLSSPFSVEAVELLERVGVAAWKIASGEVSNTPMFERIAATGLPVLLSSGMSSLAEIDGAAALVKERSLPLTVLQCTSMYPTPPEKIGLNLIPFFRERYECAVGLSDHSGMIYAGLAAAAIGIDVLEVHLTLSREAFGPDVPASVTTSELTELVKGIRFIETMNANPVDKEAMAQELAPLRDLFTKSLVVRLDLPAGTILKVEHLAIKKPGTGIPAKQLNEVVGKRLRRTVVADELLQEQDLAEED